MYVPLALLRYLVVGCYPPYVYDILSNPCNLKVVLKAVPLLIAKAFLAICYSIHINAILFKEGSEVC